MAQNASTAGKTWSSAFKIVFKILIFGVAGFTGSAFRVLRFSYSDAPGEVYGAQPDLKQQRG